MAAAIGVHAKMGIGTTSTVDQPLDFHSENLAVAEEFHDSNGLRGTRSRAVERVRRNIRRIGGSINFQPNPQEMAYLLPWILGANASGTTYALAETVQARYVTIDRVTKVLTYDNCKVNRATFRASQGGPLEVGLDVLGVDETVANAGTFPAINLDVATGGPFMFTELVLVIGGVTYQAREFEVSVDNMVQADRFFNSETLSTAAQAQDRMITLRTSLPYGDAVAAYGSGPGGVAVTATFTNGAMSFLMTFVKVTFPRHSATVPGRTEIMLPMMGVAYKSATTEPLVCTLDHSP